MASTSAAALLRQSSSLVRVAARRPAPSQIAAFAARTYATPSGPPPSGFRLPQQKRWDENKESALDQAGKYFLLTEMFRGMYVVLEQYFRPPYVYT
jgi:NADH dehydrogenase (ubiquinone) Fe-S protein 8